MYKEEQEVPGAGGASAAGYGDQDRRPDSSREADTAGPDAEGFGAEPGAARFAFLGRIKALFEQECPGIVSCADVLAPAARDAIGVILSRTFPCPPEYIEY
jgi:hypothetical protein